MQQIVESLTAPLLLAVTTHVPLAHMVANANRTAAVRMVAPAIKRPANVTANRVGLVRFVRIVAPSASGD